MTHSTSRARVAWIAVEPTPYNMPLFDRLRRSDKIDIEFFFCAEQVHQPWSFERYPWLAAARCGRKPISLRGHFFNPDILRTLMRGTWDAVVLSGYGHLTMQVAILYCTARRIPFLIHSDTHLLAPRSRLKRAMKRCFLFPWLRCCGAALGVGALARQYWESVGIPPDRVFVVSCASHLDEFCDQARQLAARRGDLRKELGLADDVVAGIYVGRLVAVKALDLLLRGLAALSPDRRPCLLLVGDGPERARLEQMVAEHSLPVRFLGFRQNDELSPLYAASDFFVLSSRREAWGVVVGEAMAAGLPVILSDRVGAAYDLLQDGSNGYLVTEQTPEAWRNALRRCTANRENLRTMGKRSSEIISGWTCDEIAAQFFRAVDVAINHRRHSP